MRGCYCDGSSYAVAAVSYAAAAVRRKVENGVFLPAASYAAAAVNFAIAAVGFSICYDLAIVYITLASA